MDLGLEVSERNGAAVVTVRGELEMATAPRFREKVVALVADGHRHIVVDLEGVEFLDSIGLGVLVGTLKRARTHGGDLHLVCTRSRVLKALEITGLDLVFDVHDTLGAATEAAAGR